MVFMKFNTKYSKKKKNKKIDLVLFFNNLLKILIFYIPKV